MICFGRGFVSAAFAIGFLLPNSSVAAAADWMHRSLFYANTPFGSLGWMRGSKTRSSARNRLTVDNLSDATCIILPGKGIQWFIVNHSDTQLGGEPGYFSIRILYRTESDGQDGYIRQGLHVYRNGNWYDADGMQRGVHERNPEQISVTEEEFISLHASEQEADSYASIQRAVGPWHMKPTVESDTSWMDRHLYGARLRAYLSANTTAISARLLRFTATSSVRTADPVVFWLEPSGATSALILIDAPRHDFTGARRVYDVKFGGTCP